MKKERDYSIDAVGAIMIIFMIYGHICLWCGIPMENAIERVLYIFMTWFFFKSGMYFRQDTMVVVFRKGWKRLMIPFIAFSVIGQLVFSIMWLCDGKTQWQDYILSPLRTLLHQGAVVGNSPLWFLLTLFIVRLVFNCCLKYGKKAAILGCCLTAVLAWGLNHIGFMDFFYIGNTCLGLFFFGCGYFLKEIQYKRWLFALCLLCYLAYVIWYPSYIDMRSNAVLSSAYVPCILSCLCGIVAWNNVMRMLGRVVKPLAYIGRNSMTYYVVHWAVLGCLSIVAKNILSIQDQWTMFLIFSVGNILLLPTIDILMSRYCKVLLGK